MAAITVSDPQQLKNIVLDVLRENPEILQVAIKELLDGKASKKTVEAPNSRKEKMRALIQEDFDKYEGVFNALA